MWSNDSAYRINDSVKIRGGLLLVNNDLFAAYLWLEKLKNVLSNYQFAIHKVLHISLRQTTVPQYNGMVYGRFTISLTLGTDNP